MKKLLLTLGLVGFSFTSSLAQGGINPLNNSLTRVQICADGQNLRNATASDGLRFSIWFGPANSAAGDLVQVGNDAVIGTTAGIIAGWPSLFVIPQAQPGEAVSLQIRMQNVIGFYWSLLISLRVRKKSETQVVRTDRSSFTSAKQSLKKRP